MPPTLPATPPSLRRRTLALGLGALGLWPGAAPGLSARRLEFPRDHGSHPELRTEWWYMTGHAQTAGRLWGFQVTFFRSRVDGTQGLRSAFAAKQLLFAHAAITDVTHAKLHHDQRIARAWPGLAEASEADTGLRLQGWSLTRSALGQGSRYTARVEGDTLGLHLDCDTTQPVLLQGREGLSRKGPEAVQASHYYSQSQLAVQGELVLGGQRWRIAPGQGRAWLDHEWSEALMHPQAVGWDWIGMNLHDGAALTAFRLRRADGSALWAGGSWRPAGGAVQVFDEGSVVFTAVRHWTSPHSGARYPVQWRVETPAGRFEVRALVDDQELDSSASTGAIYWEGLSDLHDAKGQSVGRGYLEMTGYARALRL